MDSSIIATINYTSGRKEATGGDEVAAGGRVSGEVCSSCPKRIREFIPAKYRHELVELLKLACPVVLSQLLIFMISVVSTVFCSRLGKTELAGVSLAILMINVSGIFIGTGLAQACDTLITQQLASSLMVHYCHLLLQSVAHSTSFRSVYGAILWPYMLYVKIFMPVLPASFMFQLQARYLQNQGIMWPQVLTAAAANVLNALINYILVHYLDYGVVGSAAANAISQCSLSALLYMYICWKGLHKATWGGWSLDCLQEWGLFVKLAISTMSMFCLGLFVFEISGFLAGLISETELGAQYISYELSLIAFMTPVGLSAAATVRVGNAVGAGKIKQAKLSCKVAIICTFVISFTFGAILIITRNVIGYIFTSEKDIVQKVAEIMLLYGLTHFADAAVEVTGGILRAVGRQMIGALCKLVGYYIISLPIGVSLMFPAHMGIAGLWIGFAICLVLLTVCFIAFVCKLNWQKVVEEAYWRAGIQSVDGKETHQMENSDSNRSPSLVATVSSVCVNVEEGGARCEVRCLVQDKPVTTTVGEALSRRQLLVRRSSAVLLMVLILVAGITVNELLV